MDNILNTNIQCSGYDGSSQSFILEPSKRPPIGKSAIWDGPAQLVSGDIVVAQLDEMSIFYSYPNNEFFTIKVFYKLTTFGYKLTGRTPYPPVMLKISLGDKIRKIIYELEERPINLRCYDNRSMVIETYYKIPTPIYQASQSGKREFIYGYYQKCE